MTRRWLWAWVLCGCAGAQRPAAPTPTCAGDAPTSPPGMRAVDDVARRDRVVHPAGEGGLCVAAVFEVVEPVTLYRRWTRARPQSRTGRWWTLTESSMTAAQYRDAYAVCPEWNDLDATVRCVLPPGSRVVVGPGQSVRCDAGVAYPASPAAQVFVEDPAALRDCVDGAP